MFCFERNITSSNVLSACKTDLRDLIKENFDNKIVPSKDNKIRYQIIYLEKNNN